MANKIKLKWRVAEESTGPYRSFNKRGFPSAEYQNGECAAVIWCDDSYHPATHRNATDLSLTMRIAVWKDGTFKWQALRGRASSIAEAKKRIEGFLNGVGNEYAHPDYREVQS